MKLVLIDWAFIIWYLILAIGIGIYYSRRAGRSLSEFFVSGRTLPWWLLGTSMVATTFAADTPLAVTGIVIKDGISGNWFWWNFLFGGALTVFFFAHLWRRAEVLTEVEFIHIRYSGRSARFLRGFKAVYLGIPVSAIIFGWVTLAMVQIFRVVFNISEISALVLCLAITIFYTTLSGLWGVVTTDVLQFSMAVVGAVVLSVVSLEKVGGVGRLLESINSLAGQNGKDYLSILPDFSEALPLAFFVALFVQWWAVYYPGAEPGGGGWIVQRMLAAKNPRHSVLGTLWFNIAHYVIRPWPWIITALCALIIFPEISGTGAGNAESVYPRMIGLLPAGIKGMMIASFLAAYMSTIDSLLTLSSSYLVNDLYKPFVRRDAPDSHYVKMGRLCTVLLMVLAAIVALWLQNAKQAFDILLQIGAGTGLIFILRWFWWRINAFTEISAMIISFVVACLFQFVVPGVKEGAEPMWWQQSYWQLCMGIAITTTTWLIVT